MNGSSARRLDGCPSLDDIAADPVAVEALSDAEVAALMVRAVAVQGTLQARVLRGAVLDAAALRGRERMLTAAEVAERLGRSVSWLEKHKASLPPRRSLAGSPAWREADIDEWIRTRPVLQGPGHGR